MYINSTGCSRDGETVSAESESYAIYDDAVRLEPHPHGGRGRGGGAGGDAAGGEKGRSFMLPHATAMLQQPNFPSGAAASESRSSGRRCCPTRRRRSSS